MDTDLMEPVAPAPRKPKFHLRTLLIGFLKRSPILLVCIGLGVMGAIKGAKKLGKKTFAAETLVRYERQSEVHSETDEKTLILTLRDTVKVENNLEEVKTRLKLKESTAVLAKACEVEVQKNTTLLSISAQWNTASGAADLANTVRDVFMESYRRNTKTELRHQLDDLNRRLDTVRRQLKDADTVLQKFTSANQVVDIEKQSRAMLEESNSMSVLLEQAQADKKTIEEQSAKLGKVISDLKDRVAKEQTSNAALESLSDLSIRIGKIKEAIRDDKDYRSNLAEMNLRQQEMDRARSLRDLGALSEQDYQRAVTAYEKAKIAAQDTDQIKAWKADLEALQKRVIPNGGVTAPSAPILQAMLVRTFDIQLQQVAVQEKVSSLTAALTRTKRQLERIPLLQRQYDALSRNVTSLETERKEIEDRISVMQRAYEAQAPDFAIVTAAHPEKDPTKSSGKLIAIGIGAGGLVLGLLLVVGLELLDTTIRSGPEVEMRMEAPLLGELPRRRRKSLFPESSEARLTERLTVLSHGVRATAPQKGGRLLFVSVAPDEGAAWLAANLAACYGRQGEQVVLVEMLAEGHERRILGSLLAGAGPDQGAALEDYLARKTDEPGGLAQPTEQIGVALLSRGGRPFSPDLFSSTRMAALYEALSAEFSVVVTIASPALESIEAQLLARSANAVVLVTQSRRLRAKKLRGAIEKLQATGTTIAGVVLTGVTRLYQAKD